MFRRSFIAGAALAAPLSVACHSDPEPARPAPADASAEARASIAPIVEAIEHPASIELSLVDDETPFADEGVPYLMALLEDGQFRSASGLRVELGPGYGRTAGAMIERVVTVRAPQRHLLQQFFAARDPAWQLPSTHQIRYGPVGAHERVSSPGMEWQAYVVRTPALSLREHLIRVEPDPQGIELTFDRRGAKPLHELSRDNVGRRVALSVGDVVFADPVINEAISNGRLLVSVQEQDDVGHRALAEALLPGRPHAHG